jgi:hypothetical protein
MKMLASILENATLEEDDSLQDMWAALLANAATAQGEPEVMLSEILRQLSPADAHLLRRCFREIVAGPIDRSGGFFSVGKSIDAWAKDLNRQDSKQPYPVSALSFENLLRLGLLSPSTFLVDGEGGTFLSKIGWRFIYACENPDEIKAAEERLSKDPRVRFGS